MYCKNCGARITIGEKYCANCGTPVTQSSPNTAVITITKEEARNGCRKKLYAHGMVSPMSFRLKPGITDKKVLEVKNARYYDNKGAVVIKPLRVTVRVKGRHSVGKNRMKWWIPIATVFLILLTIGLLNEINTNSNGEQKNDTVARENVTKDNLAPLDSANVFAQKDKSHYGEKTQEQILTDIINTDAYFHNYSLTPVYAEVVKRQTNPDKKTDYVWVYVKAQNDDFSYDAHYELAYVKYNDGWSLKRFSSPSSESSYEALKTPDRQIADATIQSTYSDLEDITYVSGAYGQIHSFNADTDEEYKNMYIMTYSAQQMMSDSLAIELEIQVILNFTPVDSWFVSKTSESIVGENWNINGAWSFEDEDVKLSVEVLDFNNSQKTATIEYSFYTSIDLDESKSDPYYLRKTRLMPGEVYSSSVPVTIDLTEYTYGTEPSYSLYYYFSDQADASKTIAQIWFCGSPMNWVMAGEGDGISICLIGSGSNRDLVYWLKRN